VAEVALGGQYVGGGVVRTEDLVMHLQVVRELFSCGPRRAGVPLGFGSLASPSCEGHTAQMQCARGECLLSASEGRFGGHDRPVHYGKAALKVSAVEEGTGAIPCGNRCQQRTGCLAYGPALTHRSKLNQVHPSIPRGKGINHAVHVG
jgi:hypothetical protein